MQTRIPDTLYSLTACIILPLLFSFPATGRAYTYKSIIYSYKTDSLPQFDYSNIRQYIFSKFHYPQTAIEKGIEGEVRIKFCIDTNGYINNIRVVKSVHPILDSTAIEIFRQMPRWKPILKQGLPERIFYTVPVIFETPRSNQKSKTAKN